MDNSSKSQEGFNRACELAEALLHILEPLRKMDEPNGNNLVKDSRLTQKALPILDNPKLVFEQIPSSVKKSKKEHFLGLYLNARSQLISLETISIGTLSASLVHPRETYIPAIRNHAAALIVAHNHPSGDVSPSFEDKQTTERLKKAGEILGITLLDHLIVSPMQHFSFREHGLI